MADQNGILAAIMMMDDDDDENETWFDMFATTMLAYVAQTTLRNPRSRIHGYVEDVVPRYNEMEFRRMFRMSCETFDTVSNHLKHCPELYVGGYGGREPVSVEKQLYITLWYFGGTDSITRIADRFGVSESSVILSRKRVIDTILNNLKSKFISWPQGQLLQDNVDNFERRNGFPGIIGALDGTHISIKAPQENPQSYVNRKKIHSLQLQAVCNSEMIFTDCFAGFPGSCHDARVLRNSPLFENGLALCNGNHVLADGAYPLRRWLLTPYRDNGHLSQEQKNFNYVHSSNRVVIERSFGLLKGRFRRLHHVDTLSVQTAVEIIMAACVLHNICLMEKDDIAEFMGADDDVDGDLQQNFQMQENEAEGVVKRNLLARTLFRH